MYEAYLAKVERPEKAESRYQEGHKWKQFVKNQR